MEWNNLDTVSKFIKKAIHSQTSIPRNYPHGPRKLNIEHEEATGKLYHLRLRVECTLFCNLQSRARTHAVLVIGLYELLDNPTT
jgi:hypothetical protein